MTSDSSYASGTHEVRNQPPPLEGIDLYASDRVLLEALAGLISSGSETDLRSYGRLAGGELMDAGVPANRNRPELRTHDRFGHRIDTVEFHPAYHTLMVAAMAHGLHSRTWEPDAPGDALLTRSVLMYLHNQADAGTMCPVTMTHAAMPALRGTTELAAEMETRLLARCHDRRDIPWWDKAGLTLGMGMTEKQGGSDVRANQTVARPTAAGDYRLTGHKWFFSAPMSDAFLVLAQAPRGLSCFLLPRWRRNGTRNAIRIQRLKDKLGNWSNASAEVEFLDAEAYPIGAEGDGIQRILPVVIRTRLDCMIGSASLMRQAVSQALHHCRFRRAFGKPLVEQPLMRNVLADLALESEAALLLWLRVAQASASAASEPEEAALARIGTAIGKFWICKRAPGLVHEAQECLGGNGYVEESILPRLYREAPVNSIWEGSGNVQCLDVLRALEREPACLDALQGLLVSGAGRHPLYDEWWEGMASRLGPRRDTPATARRLVEDLGLGLQACLFLLRGPKDAADAFCRGRLGPRGLVFGDLPADVNLPGIIARAMPEAEP